VRARGGATREGGNEERGLLGGLRAGAGLAVARNWQILVVMACL
jgi:hypothetical protein